MGIEKDEAIEIAERAAKLGANIVVATRDGKLSIIEILDLIGQLTRLAKFAMKAARD